MWAMWLSQLAGIRTGSQVKTMSMCVCTYVFRVRKIAIKTSEKIEKKWQKLIELDLKI